MILQCQFQLFLVFTRFIAEMVRMLEIDFHWDNDFECKIYSRLHIC